MRENTFKVQTSAGKIMASVFWDSEGNLASGILEDRCHIQFRAICADIKKLKTMNLKGSDKQEDESSSHPSYSQ
jgi:hypothetical protein